MDALVQTLKELTVNDTGYYASYSENANDTKCDPTNDPKTVTHTSYRKKRKVIKGLVALLLAVVEK